MVNVYLNRISTAVPRHDVHSAFIEFALEMLAEDRARELFRRMILRSGIGHRYSCLSISGKREADDVDAYDFYRQGRFPSTSARMHLFERFAPQLAKQALDRLALSSEERGRIRHVLVTSCTGFYAPGLDFEVAQHLGLDPSVERTMIGFMGCYAAINALRLARHIVRSEPEDRVLVLNLELCTLHFQETQDLNEVLSFLIFGDGCAASLVSSEAAGLQIDSFRTLEVPNTRELITWNVRDLGFDMLLSGRVPEEIGKALTSNRSQFPGSDPDVLWAVHPGGRSVLDSVQESLSLPPEALRASRTVLSRFGNMSSATVMFVLQELMTVARAGQVGCAMSFGPGLTAETMRFRAV